MFIKIKLKNGFTLLEILIALLIFTIVSLMAANTLHNVLNNQTRVQNQSQSFSQLESALLLLSHDLEQTVNRSILNTQGESEAAFMGNSLQVTFTHAGLSNPFNQSQRSTLQRTRYRIENGNLIRDVWLVLDQAPNSQPLSRILLRSVTDFHLSYLDQGNHYQKQWPPVEKSLSPLPKAIQISITQKQWGKIEQFLMIPVQGQENEKKP